MGYENCGRREQYPYDKLFDGKPHIIRASYGTVRTLRYGAARRGLKFTEHSLGDGRYEIMAAGAARVEDSRLPLEKHPAADHTSVRPLS